MMVLFLYVVYKSGHIFSIIVIFLLRFNRYVSTSIGLGRRLHEKYEQAPFSDDLLSLDESPA